LALFSVENRKQVAVLDGHHFAGDGSLLRCRWQTQSRQNQKNSYHLFSHHCHASNSTSISRIFGGHSRQSYRFRLPVGKDGQEHY
jgi:hypothetical protein